MMKLIRYTKNPIISPNKNNIWESKATFNPGIVQLKGKIYIVYRAMNPENTSTLGLAISSDGFNIEERLDIPIYVPRMRWEMKLSGKKNTVFEDPRLTVIGNRIYMTYTAVADNIPYVRVALTSITIKDFLERRWSKWEKPRTISPPGVWDKDAFIHKLRKNLYVFFHRLIPSIWIDFFKDFSFKEWLKGHQYILPRKGKWDNYLIGSAGPPIEITEGLILIYHGVSSYDWKYRIGAMLLDKENPTRVISRPDDPILEPEMRYENKIVFSCGHAVLDGQLLVYYGAADKYIGIAYCNLNDLISELLKAADF